MSSSDAMSINNQQKEILKESGRELIVIPDKIYRKIHYAVPTFENAMKDYQDLYSYNFVDFEDLTPMEKETFGLSRKIIDFLQRNNFRSKTKIKISETISSELLGDKSPSFLLPAILISIIQIFL